MFPLQADDMGEEEPILELNLIVEPRLVSVTRRYIEGVLERLLPDGDLVYRVAMAAHELLENAAKYADDRRARLTVSLRVQDGVTSPVVRLSNRTSRQHVDKLKERFNEMGRWPDPYELYWELMRRHVNSAEVSGLGLVRIRAEGEMQLKLHIEERDIAIEASA